MSDQVFRIVVASGVFLACIAFLVQAMVALAFYRTARKMHEKVDEIADTVEPVIHKIGPLVDKLVPIIDTISPIMERIGPMMEKTGEVMDQVAPVVQKVGVVVDNVRLTVATTNQILEDTRTRISEVSTEVAGIARSGREQVERVGALLHDASDRARHRLEQIDQSVESTVNQVGQVGDAMKRAVLRPVREVNGGAAGIPAAVSSLVKGRKFSVDAATLDEEMFI